MPATLPTSFSSSAASAALPRLHLKFLDGLRGMAALLVMTSHLWRTYTKVALPGAAGFWTNWLGDGHLWVNVFIVLSGFSLMLPVTRSRTLRGGWQTFYRSRARRILPPLYAAIGLAILLSLLHHWPVGKATVLANVLLLQDLWQSRDILDGPLWSVALEWKIYFLFPLFVWLWIRFGPPLVLITAAAISGVLLALLTASRLVPDISHACPWYVLLFAFGMVSADFARRDTVPKYAHRWAYLIAGFCVATGSIQAHFWPDASPSSSLPLADSFTGLAVALLLFLLSRPAPSGAVRVLSAPMLAVLSWPPLAFIGTFAYSVYLIHVLLIYDIKKHLVTLLHTPAPFVIIPIDMALVVAAAYLFHLAFERPFMSRPGQTIKTEREAEAAAISSPAP